MDPPWVYAFVAALLVVLVGTPPLRRLALATGIVDRPDGRKVHEKPVPDLGGVGIMAGVLAALVFLPELGGRAAAIALVGVMLGAIGLIDDDRNVHPGVRFLAEASAAALAVVVGLRIHATGLEAVDIALTIVWILGITNALNLLDNMDALAAGVAGTAAFGVFLLALLGGQEVAATVSAGLAGACGGFLVFNRRPASIFMGDAGSLFLGFILAVLAIDVNPGLGPPVSFAVPVILLGLAVLDTTTVTLSRLRRGRSVAVGGKDHLSHRLVALGLSPGRAVGVLLAVQALLTVLAVLSGRRVIDPGPACAAALATLGAVAAVTSRASVYPEPARGFPSWLRVGLFGAAGVTGLLTAPAVIAVISAGGPAREGAAQATAALRAVRDAEPGRTRAAFARAEALFGRAQSRLDNPFVSLGLVVPGVSTNLRATRTLADAGRELAAEGARLATAADVAGIRIKAGSVDLDQLARLAPDLEEASRALTAVQERLSSADRDLLLRPFREAMRDLHAVAADEARTMARMADATRALPGVLGEEGPRRYLLVAGTRPLGDGPPGLLVPSGELVAAAGRVRHEPVGADPIGPEMPRSGAGSLDFPTVARALIGAEGVSGGRFDGVIYADAAGLSALTRLAGPALLEGEVEPVTPATVVDVAERTSMSTVSEAVWRHAVAADLGNGRRVVTGLTEAVREGHLLFYLTDPPERAFLSRLGATGEVPAVRGDSVMVVGASRTPDGSRLRHQVSYDVRIEPGPRQARLTAEVAVILHNQPADAGSPAQQEAVAGPSHTEVSVYSPFRVTSAAVDGEALPLRTDEDLGRRVGSAALDVAPSQSRTLRFQLAGDIVLGEGGWYRLDVVPELGSSPEEGRITVSVPPGWRITETRGLSTPDATHATGSLSSDRPPSFWARVERSPAGQLWDRLRGRG